MTTVGVAKGKQKGTRIRGRFLDGGNTLRKDRCSLMEIETGTGTHDESASHQEFRCAVPASNGEPGVGAQKAEEFVVECKRGERKRAFDSKYGFDGVVGTLIGERSVEAGDLDARIAAERQGSHGDAVLETGRRRFVLKRLQADRRDEDAIQVEAVEGEAGERDVSTMGRVETTAEERDSHFADAK